ncbi:hypothetical protein AVEN_135899-1 [Araneus ventricosus]|uniref:Uncharacterized protein n=1 Tax=Araneus ventricosus TaxID=182803 RepID=A0A4Y2KQI9_ARAVE|nr:hypothetical protein AVEN_135899-1 [Araneus ventricosus]
MGPLNDSRCNISSTEAGVLIASHLATALPLPKEVRTITGGVSRTLLLLYPRGSECPLTYPAATHPCTRGAPGERIFKVTGKLKHPALP